MQADDKRPLGRSGLSVGPLGWGMWRLGQGTEAGTRELIETALEVGCTLFDTADIYGFDGQAGFGRAESLLGEVLHATPSLRERMVLASKAGIKPPVPYDSSQRYLTAACEASLRRLHTEYLDLFQVHRPDLLAHPAEVAGALTHLRETGKIRAAGVSNYSASQLEALRAHLPFELASIQPELSPLSIEALTDGVLDTAMRLGLGVLAWSPLAQGRLMTSAAAGTRTAAVIAELDRVARRAGTPRASVAYAWVMAHPSRPVPLIGSQSVGRIREARAAFAVSLTREEWYRILVAARGEPMP